MALITFDHVAQYLGDVTAQQIGKVRKALVPGTTGESYAVQNERGDRDPDGEILEYLVKYDPQRGFTCSCPAGSGGFVHVHHWSGVCKHCRWVVACVLEQRAALDELARAQEAAHIDGEPGTRAHLLTINGQEASPREYARILNAQPQQVNEAEIQHDLTRFTARPFQIER